MDFIVNILTEDLDKCTPYNCCYYSSFVFIINIFIGLVYSYFLYAGLFVLLMITSLLQHSHYTLITTLADKIAIYSVVVYGGNLFYYKLTTSTDNSLIMTLLIVLTFLSTILLYYYGKMNKCFCFCENKTYSNQYLSLTHFIGSFGHCCIMLL
jgi:hypothetical protein